MQGKSAVVHFFNMQSSLNLIYKEKKSIEWTLAGKGWSAIKYGGWEVVLEFFNWILFLLIYIINLLVIGFIYNGKPWFVIERMNPENAWGYTYPNPLPPLEMYNSVINISPLTANCGLALYLNCQLKFALSHQRQHSAYYRKNPTSWFMLTTRCCFSLCLNHVMCLPQLKGFFHNMSSFWGRAASGVEASMIEAARSLQMGGRSVFFCCNSCMPKCCKWSSFHCFFKNCI